MNRKKLLCAGLCLILLITCWGCAQGQEDPAVAFFHDYLEAMKVSNEAALPYVYFESEANKEMFLDASGNRLLSYEILQSEKINDNLTAVTYYSEDNLYGELTWTSFVARMDGEYKVIRNVSSVPKELSENLVEDNYTDPDGLWMDFEDIASVTEAP